MDEIQLAAHRIERLKAAIEKIADGNRTEFGKKLGYQDGAFVRQMLSGLRPVSEKTIRAIEAMRGMAKWFDEDVSKLQDDSIGTPVSSWPFETFQEADVRKLSDIDRGRLEGAIALALAQLKIGLPVSRRVVNATPVAEVTAPFDDAVNDSDYVEVSRYNVKLSAGTGRFAFEEDVRNKLAFRRDFLRSIGVRPENAMIATASGPSMEPEIPDGASLLVNRQELSLEDMHLGAVYGLSVGEGLLVKMITRDDQGRLVARSSNSTFEDIVLEGNTRFRVVGQIHWMCKRL